jgi:HEAT repeat protein
MGVLAAISTALFAQSEELGMYTYLYKEASTLVDRLGILQNTAEANLSGSEEFFAQALEDLLEEYPNIRSVNDRAAADATARFLAQVLGEKKYTAAGLNLWRVVEVFSNSLVKADALIAMGQVGATELLPQVIQLLSDLNTRPSADRETGERIAYGAILSLENYKDPAGYLPVFFASVGWYSDRIKNQAAASLPAILADPSEPLTSVIKSSGYPYEVKYQALRTIENSEVTTRSKAAVAVTAFAEAWRASTSDTRQRIILANTRKLAISMIRRYGTDDASVYPLLERSYTGGIDEEEQFGTVMALAALGTDDSARLLSNFLLAINTNLRRGLLTQGDERMVRAIIPALGATGRSLGAPALRDVLAADWTNAVKNLANEALKGLH